MTDIPSPSTTKKDGFISRKNVSPEKSLIMSDDTLKIHHRTTTTATSPASSIHFDEEKKDETHHHHHHHHHILQDHHHSTTTTTLDHYNASDEEEADDDDEENAKKKNKSPRSRRRTSSSPSILVGASNSTTSTANTTITTQIQILSTRLSQYIRSIFTQKHTLKRIFSTLFTLLALILFIDTIQSPPESRILQMSSIRSFLLTQVNDRPILGLCTFIIFYGFTLVVLLPATPLTLGVGYVCKESYGWVGGVFLGTVSSLAGSLLGSVVCFVIGRYLMRDAVRSWGRKRYPIFDAIDLAVSDNGLKVMSLLYLTPILPLGPVSYMMGTTSMNLSSFAMAKIAALPLMILYVFIGASTGTLVGEIEADEEGEGEKEIGNAAAKKLISKGAAAAGGVETDAESKRKLMMFGIVLSVISIALVSHFVKKTLYEIFDKQKEEKRKAEGSLSAEDQIDENVELGLQTVASGFARHRRQRKYLAIKEGRQQRNYSASEDSLGGCSEVGR